MIFNSRNNVDEYERYLPTTNPKVRIKEKGTQRVAITSTEQLYINACVASEWGAADYNYVNVFFNKKEKKIKITLSEKKDNDCLRLYKQDHRSNCPARTLTLRGMFLHYQIPCKIRLREGARKATKIPFELNKNSLIVDVSSLYSKEEK